MLYSIKDDEGKIVAYIEWELMQSDGKTCDESGKYVYVQDLFIHKSMHSQARKIIRGFIQKIILNNPTARFGYWLRRKHQDRMSLYTKEQLNGWRYKDKLSRTPSTAFNS